MREKDIDLVLHEVSFTFEIDRYKLIGVLKKMNREIEQLKKAVADGNIQ